MVCCQWNGRLIALLSFAWNLLPSVPHYRWTIKFLFPLCNKWSVQSHNKQPTMLRRRRDNSKKVGHPAWRFSGFAIMKWRSCVSYRRKDSDILDDVAVESVNAYVEPEETLTFRPWQGHIFTSDVAKRPTAIVHSSHNKRKIESKLRRRDEPTSAITRSRW